MKTLTPEENRIILQTAAPEAILSTYNMEKPEETQIAEMLIWADAIVIGPGLGTEKAANFLVREVLKERKKPVLLDADALNLIAKEENLMQMLEPNKIVTPHLGEMARLTGRKILDIQGDIVGSAKAFAKERQVICVLKDARTVTALPDGTCYLNRTGNSGMATAGSGDVLSGIIGSLLVQGQGMSPAAAAPAGVCLHGMAGDIAAETIGKTGMTASDLIDGIRCVCKALADEHKCGELPVK